MVNMILVLTICWCPYVETSLVGRGCLIYPVCSLGKTISLKKKKKKTLSLCPAPFCTPRKICLLPQVSLTSYFCIPFPHNEKHIFFGYYFRRSCSFHQTIQLQLLQHYWLGHILGLLWYWMVCLGNGWVSSCCFLRLHPSTAFQTLLLTVRATPQSCRLCHYNTCYLELWAYRQWELPNGITSVDNLWNLIWISIIGLKLY